MLYFCRWCCVCKINAVGVDLWLLQRHVAEEQTQPLWNCGRVWWNSLPELNIRHISRFGRIYSQPTAYSAYRYSVTYYVGLFTSHTSEMSSRIWQREASVTCSCLNWLRYVWMKNKTHLFGRNVFTKGFINNSLLLVCAEAGLQIQAPAIHRWYLPYARLRRL